MGLLHCAFRSQLQMTTASYWRISSNGNERGHQVDKMGMTLIKIRLWFHPLHAKHLVLMVTAITAHMLLQMWLYHTGR